MIKQKRILLILGLIFLIAFGKNLLEQKDFLFLKPIINIQEIGRGIEEKNSHSKIQDIYNVHDYRERKPGEIIEEELPYGILYYDEETYTYSYQIFLKNGDLLEEVNDLKGIVTIKDVTPNLLKVRISAGSYAVTEQFFDIESGEISEIFPEIAAITERRIAYMTMENGEICLILRDIFTMKVPFSAQRKTKFRDAPCATPDFHEWWCANGAHVGLEKKSAIKL